jgi:RNA polymerase sigma factor (TIGR02999 family)
MTETTRILSAIEQGDPHASEKLLPLVYDELRRLAVEKLAHEKPGQTLEATALVHEAYLRLLASPGRESGVSPPANAGSSPHWDSRRHFFAAAAEAMRRILIDRARRKQHVRHGGGRQRIDLDEALSIAEPRLDLLALDEALAQLASKQPIKAELVKLRFFAGLTMPETAQALDISLATAERYWRFARSWLLTQLEEKEEKA